MELSSGDKWIFASGVSLGERYYYSVWYLSYFLKSSTWRSMAVKNINVEFISIKAINHSVTRSLIFFSDLMKDDWILFLSVIWKTTT